MLGGLNFGDQVPLSGAAEDDVALVVDWSGGVVERGGLKRPVVRVRRVGDDANTGVLDEGAGCRVVDGDAEMHRADLGPVRQDGYDDFVGAGGSAMELQGLVEDVGAPAGGLSHGEQGKQHQHDQQGERA